MDFLYRWGVAPPSNTGRQRLNIRTKEVITLFQPTANQEGTLKFLKILREKSEERKIYLTNDNASYYRAKSIQEYTANNIERL